MTMMRMPTEYYENQDGNMAGTYVEVTTAGWKIDRVIFSKIREHSSWLILFVQKVG